MQLKVLMVTSAFNSGGAGKAAHRLAVAISEHSDADVTALCLNGASDWIATTKIASSAAIYNLAKALDRVSVLPYPNRAELMRSINFSDGRSLFGAASKINALKPDVVHIHWINYGLLGIEELRLIEAPIVWTFHDMWPMTGGCHYSIGCEQFLNSCGSCPVIGSTDNFDRTSKVQRRKKDSWSDIKLKVITPSYWLSDLASRSYVFGNHDITTIPNCIGLNDFYPVDRTAARLELGLPINGQIILAGAHNGLGSIVKGRRMMPVILDYISVHKESEVYLVTIGGRAGPSSVHGANLQTIALGNLNTASALRAAYCAADVFILPSLQDNLPNMVAESLACGTKVVAFASGGAIDMIHEGETGYVIPAYDTSKFGCATLSLAEEEKTPFTQQRVRDSSIGKFDPKKIVEAHLRVYQEAVSSNPRVATKSN
jgi:glycosyltransferase involved in cell wall biosynthesis